MIYTVYQSLLALGGVGLAFQAILGLGHSHQHAGGHHADAGVAHDGGHEPGFLHLGRLGAGARGRSPGSRVSRGRASAHGREAKGSWSAWDIFAPLLALLSPLTIFSLCVGVGATGMILESYRLPSLWVVLGAIAGGLVFYGLIVRSIWSFIFRFASKPSEALEGTVAQEAVAVSRFDGGKGVVQVTIDGQLVRVLANLEAGDSERIGEIQPGERLLVVSVDGHSNSCRVMRI